MQAAAYPARWRRQSARRRRRALAPSGRLPARSSNTTAPWPPRRARDGRPGGNRPPAVEGAGEVGDLVLHAMGKCRSIAHDEADTPGIRAEDVIEPPLGDPARTSIAH